MTPGLWLRRAHATSKQRELQLRFQRAVLRRHLYKQFLPGQVLTIPSPHECLPALNQLQPSRSTAGISSFCLG